MKDLKEMTLIDLANRLNEIDREKQKLDIEYNQIIYELWDRIPTLKENENTQPKVIKKGVKK